MAIPALGPASGLPPDSVHTPFAHPLWPVGRSGSGPRRGRESHGQPSNNPRPPDGTVLLHAWLLERFDPPLGTTSRSTENSAEPFLEFGAWGLELPPRVHGEAGPPKHGRELGP